MLQRTLVNPSLEEQKGLLEVLDELVKENQGEAIYIIGTGGIE